MANDINYFELLLFQLRTWQKTLGAYTSDEQDLLSFYMLNRFHREQLWTLTEARVVIEDNRREYNHHRPHSKLRYQSPKRIAATHNAPSPAPVALRAPEMDKSKPTT